MLFLFFSVSSVLLTLRIFAACKDFSVTNQTTDDTDDTDKRKQGFCTIRVISEIRGLIGFGCGSAALGSLWLI